MDAGPHGTVSASDQTIKCVFCVDEAEKVVQDHLEVMEGIAAKPKETGLVTDPKQPKEVAEALPGGVVDHHAVAQNQAQAGNNDAERGAVKGAVQMPYKEDELHRNGDVGARGVPLGRKIPNVAEAENNLLVEKKKIEALVKEQIEREVLAKLEKEEVEREIKERLAKKEELIRLEREKLARQLQENERIQKEVQERVEKERLQREMREKLEKEKLAREKAAAQVIHQANVEIPEKAKKGKNSEEAPERTDQLEQAAEDRNDGKAAPESQKDDGEPLKKGGRDLKENVAIQADPREGLEDRAVKDESHPQGSPEKGRDQGETDLKRKRRALGPDGAAGPSEENRAVPGLEPLLSLGGSNLHAALEQQLLAGALVHSRQIKQAPKDEGEKEHTPDTHLVV